MRLPKEALILGQRQSEVPQIMDLFQHIHPSVFGFFSNERLI